MPAPELPARASSPAPSASAILCRKPALPPPNPSRCCRRRLPLNPAPPRARPRLLVEGSSAQSYSKKYLVSGNMFLDLQG